MGVFENAFGGTNFEDVFSKTKSVAKKSTKKVRSISKSLAKRLNILI